MSVLVSCRHHQERYLGSLMPLQKNISPHKGAPRLKPFDAEEFLKTIEHSGPQLTSGLKGDWVGLYRYAIGLYALHILTLLMFIYLY